VPAVCGGNDLWRSDGAFIVKWKSDDENVDGGDDEMTCVKWGESEANWISRGCSGEMNQQVSYNDRSERSQHATNRKKKI